MSPPPADALAGPRADPPAVIAIDGPAGAGKSTVAKAVAARLGLEYLDTGAMYRAVAFAALRRGVAVTDEAAVIALTRALDLVVDHGTVLVDGVDATAAVRSREVTEHVGVVASIPAVRDELRRRQREWVEVHGGGVVEGRDIATVVFPDAPLKLYITASPRERAQRRVAQIGGDLADVEAAIVARDRSDMERSDGALRVDVDAVTVDTTGRTIDEVVDEVTERFEAVYGKRSTGGR